MRIFHVITSLGTGGAEVSLAKLLRALDASEYSPYVVSLTAGSTIGRELESHGVPTLCLGGRGGVLLPHQIWRLICAYRRAKPAIVHSWMYHANVAAQMLVGLSASSRRPALITSVRGAVHAPREQKFATRLIRRVDARLSARADAVVFNSHRSAEQHVALGYADARLIVVPNCFDTAQFRPDPVARAQVRATLGCASDTILIGLVARFHPLKDHRTFLEAACLVAQRAKECRFLLAGRECDETNGKLLKWSAELGLDDKLYLLGERRDIAAIDNALDVAVSSSISESFPNAVGEAMACGVPTVVTDVGDCAYLVGDAGSVVPPRNPEALANAILDLTDQPVSVRGKIGDRARRRIALNFALESVTERFVELYERCRLSEGRRIE